ncbi:MAG: aminoglycoside phosphotransferase family protein [Clostridia bacterium]|nr:aminoglycoside phosphotransferase family protein [Clostridia bacterium]
MTREELCSKIDEAIAAYSHIGETASCERYGNGHINDTHLLVLKSGKRYIFQRINHDIFKNPEGIMSNITLVTRHIADKAALYGKDPSRVTLTVVPTNDGKAFYRDSIGSYWRLFDFVEQTVAKDKVENIEEFEMCGEAFGEFLCMLEDFDAEKLFEVIPAFHNTPKRYENLMRAVEADVCGRVSEVGEEIEFCRARKDFAETLERAHAKGKLPLRVTHNDTKLNNILFDANDKRPACVIDLDTIMPGYVVNDFGDSIRFGATTAAEDEADLSKVKFDLELYRAYAQGYLKGARGKLTECERELLPVGAMMMTFECGMRFLTDYLEGDTYFRTSRPRHNLDRARNQFALLRDMEANLDKMKIV